MAFILPLLQNMLKKEDITNGSAGQALIKAAGSVYDVSNNSISQKSELSTTPEKKVFEGKTSRDIEAKYSDYNKPITILDIEMLRSIGRKSINNFTEDDTKKAQKWAYKFYQELGTKSPFFRAWFGDWRAYDQEQVKIVSVPTIDISQVVLAKGDYYIEDTGWNVYAGKTLNDDTRHHSGGNRINVKALNSIDAILSNSVLLDTIVSERNTKKKSENTAFLHKLYTLIKYGEQLYIAKSTVEEYYNETISDISRRAYNLSAIKIEPVGGQLGMNSSSSRPDTSSMISISDLYGFVKQFDKDFSTAHEVNEHLLNKDGTPKVFYHGTNTDFSIFDLSKSGKNFGVVSEGMFFFTNKKNAYPNSASDYAKYAVENKGGKEKIFEVYLNIQNPMIVDSSRSYDPISHYDKNAEKIYQRYFDGDYDGIKILLFLLSFYKVRSLLRMIRFAGIVVFARDQSSSFICSE